MDEKKSSGPIITLRKAGLHDRIGQERDYRYYFERYTVFHKGNALLERMLGIKLRRERRKRVPVFRLQISTSTTPRITIRTENFQTTDEWGNDTQTDMLSKD